MDIGANAILIYIAPRFIDFAYTTRFILGVLAQHVGSFAPLLLAVGLVAIKWLILLFLYRRRIFLRV